MSSPTTPVSPAGGTPAAGGGSPNQQKRKKKGNSSMMSVNSSRAKKTVVAAKEDTIAKKINELFKAKEDKMIRRIEEAMYENGHNLYNQFRLEFAEKITDLDNERIKITKKGKKKTKERTKLLLENNQLRLFYMASAVNNTVRHYKKLYFSEDVYRTNRMLDIENDQSVSKEEVDKKRLEQIKGFYDSPFKLDRKFALSYIAQMSRDKLSDSKPVIESMFFDKIYNLLLQTDDQETKIKSLEILANLIHSEEQRLRLAKNEYLKRVYEVYQSDRQVSERILENISWLTTLISFYPDMIEQIIRLNLLDFIIKICGPQFSSEIRSNAVLALSLLTYHDAMFQELIDKGVIDLVMDLCKDLSGDIKVKQYSTLALVHFALNKKSINTLVEKNVMDLFNSFGTLNDKVIQTNVSWIFLALCNNGITGKDMLASGITRDMFQVSCNQDYKEVRYLVIAGFAELGKCLNLQDPLETELTPELTKIKEIAIVGMQTNFQKTAEQSISILLNFSVSESEIHQIIAFWALRDYIMLNHEHLIDDINGIVQGFVNGSIYPQEEINTECANAISFLITHQIVYTKDEREDQPSNYVLDSLMHLTSSTSKFIRTRAFSTLSTLSTYCASAESVMLQIQRDIKLPEGKISRQYYQYILNRMSDGLKSFKGRHSVQGIEDDFAGLFWLLRIAKEPTQEIIQEAAEHLFNFIINQKKDSDKTEKDRLNEQFYIYVFHTLMHAKDHNTLLKILKVIKFYISYESPLQKDVINPETIIWLLNVLEQQKDDKLLCCKAGVTLLDIVSGHQINFEYQEVAIIKKYNKALQTLEVFDWHEVEDLSDEDDKVSLQTTRQQIETADNALKSIRDEIAKTQIEEELKQEDGDETSVKSQKKPIHHQNLPLSIDNDASEFFKKLNQPRKIKSNQTKDDSNLGDELPHNGLEEHLQQQKLSSHQSFTTESNNNNKKEAQQLGLGEIAESEDRIVSSHESFKTQSSKGGQVRQNDLKKTDIVQAIMIENIDDKDSNNPSTSVRLKEVDDPNRNMYEIKHGYTNVHILKDALVSSKLRQVNQKTNSWRMQRQYTISGLPELNSLVIAAQALPDNEGRDSTEFKDIENQRDQRIVLQILRESLIKSFLMIFTNEGSQHLLLNRDLIDIAFNCMEFIDQINEEAQQKLAKLIGIVYKFPQVHDHMLKTEVVLGVAHLLTITDNPEIISSTLKACTYLTMTYEFVSKTISLATLKNLTPLMDLMIRGEECTQDIINLVFSISNLVKGRDQNTLHFYDISGPSKFLQYLTQPQFLENVKFTELCMQTLKNVTEFKASVRAIMRDDGMEKILKVLPRTFEMTDGWIEESRGMRDKAQSTDLNVMARLVEENGDKTHSVLFASQIVLIRSYSYFLLARCIKYGGLPFSQAQETCNFTARLMQDIAAYNENQYLFESLMLALDAVKDDAEFVTKTLVPMQNTVFVLLNEYPHQDHKITLLKTLVKVLLTQVELLCDMKEGVQIFNRLFKLIENNKGDEEMQESVMHLVNQMVELGETSNVIQVCSQAKIVQIIADQINAEKKEGTLYETLHSLLSLAKEPELLDHFSSTPSLFTKLHQILQHPKIATNLELRTAIYNLLATISSHNPHICDIIMSQGFIAAMFREVRNNQYCVEQLEMPDDDYDGVDVTSSRHLNQKTRKSLDVTDEEENEDQFNLAKELDQVTFKDGPHVMNLQNVIDDPETYGFFRSATGEPVDRNASTALHDNIDRVPNANQMIEAIILIFANICLSTKSNQLKLMDLGLLDEIKKLLQLYVDYEYGSPVRQSTELIDISGLSVGSLNLVKSLTQILHSITKNVEVQETSIQRDVVSVVKHCSRLQEYEVLTNTYLSLGNLLLSPLHHVKQRAVDLGCLEMLIESNEEAEYLRVRRICNSVLQQTDPRLFEYNDSIRGNAA